MMAGRNMDKYFMRGLMCWLALSRKKASGSFLTFSAPEEFSISVKKPGWNGTLEYSIDAANWFVWDGSAISGTRLHFRGTGNTRITGQGYTDAIWEITGENVSCTGNIETLLDYATVAAGGHPTMAAYCYYFMFSGCASLVAAPELPATTLTNYCYNNMFRRCYNLVAAPELPATTLTEYCYTSMFSGCTSLTVIPKLPATALKRNCYNNMFANCSNIKLSENKTEEYNKEYRIPTEGTGKTATNSLTDMFAGTSGTFVGRTPSINTVYYLHETNEIC